MGNILKKNNKIEEYSDEIIKTNAFQYKNTYNFILTSYTCRHNNNVYLCKTCR